MMRRRADGPATRTTVAVLLFLTGLAANPVRAEERMPPVTDPVVRKECGS
jgi:hypothetical protein